MNPNMACQRIAEMRDSLINEGIINDKPFTILEQREVLMRKPKFAQEHMDSYLHDSFQIMDSVEDELKIGRPNFDKIEVFLHRLKVTSVIVGARGITNAVYEMRRCLPERDVVICKAALASVRDELENLETKLDEYFELRYQDEVGNGVNQDEGAKKEEKEQGKSKE